MAACNFESYQLYFKSVKCIHGSFSVFPIPVFVSVCLSLSLGLSLSLCPLCLCHCVSLIIRLPHVKSPGTRQTWIFFLNFFLNLLFIYYFYFWPCWVFASVRGLSPVAASGGHSSSRCAGLSPSRPLLSRSTGSRRSGSAVVAHGPSRSAACGILPDQGLNPCPLHWQADSQPLRHQGSPQTWIFILLIHLTVCDLNLSPNVSFPIIKMEIVTLTLLSCH